MFITPSISDYCLWRILEILVHSQNYPSVRNHRCFSGGRTVEIFRISLQYNPFHPHPPLLLFKPPSPLLPHILTPSPTIIEILPVTGQSGTLSGAFPFAPANQKALSFSHKSLHKSTWVFCCPCVVFWKQFMGSVNP